MKKHINREVGSMTVEACIVLPLFLCVIISIIFLIKLTYTHELIQHAINETAEEIASSAYVLQASGLKDLHDNARNSIASGTGDFKESMDNILDTLKMLEGTKSLPVEQLEAAVDYIAGGAFNNARTDFLTPVIKLYMEKYIAAGGYVSADRRLRLLNVDNGIMGMDFSQSTFFSDKEENVEIVVSYEIKLPVPIKILPELRIVQRAAAKAWLSGDEPPAADEIQSEADKIWSLGNLERGTKIRAAFGANLPFSFPVISSFDDGKAIMIKSMDLTAESYQDTFNISENLEEYIYELSRYNGQREPWGSKKIVIKNGDICSRQLLLVIPGNELLPEVERTLGKYEAVAASRGIELKIVRYGVKQNVDESG